MPASLSYACLTLRLLYDMALDSFDKPTMAAAVSTGGGRRQEEHQVSTRRGGVGRRGQETGGAPGGPRTLGCDDVAVFGCTFGASRGWRPLPRATTRRGEPSPRPVEVYVDSDSR